jgi:hypothetical protein
LSDNRLESFGRVREINEDSRQVTVCISTSGVASDNAVIDQRGWDFSRHDANPVCLWSHQDGALPIAKSIRTIPGDTETLQVHEFATHAAAEDVYQLVRQGFISATSVRWLPGETEMRTIGEGKAKRQVLAFTKGHQLLEVSYVNIPADSGALVLRADGSPFELPAAEPDVPEPNPAHGAVADSQGERLAAFAAHIRHSTELLKGA